MVSEGFGLRVQAVILLLALIPGSCAAGGNPAESGASGLKGEPGKALSSLVGASRVRVQFPDGRAFLAEVADTPVERARGLMFRERLEPDLGMIFLFDAPGLHSFWMKNTHIPLDILWIDSRGQVVHIERRVPPCAADPCPSYSPLRPAAGVLEVAAGQAGALRLGERLLVAPEASAIDP